jgi:hypothetical protein
MRHTARDLELISRKKEAAKLMRTPRFVRQDGSTCRLHPP